jgi:UDP-glucose 4-epimerase
LKILVTGGAGFIGCHLCEKLLSENNEVVCIDNFLRGNRDNIGNLIKNKKFKFYFKDICDTRSIDAIFRREKFEIVYHLAANSDIKQSANNPKIEFDNTLATTFNILNAMREANVKKIFFASTSAVYGDKEGLQVAENISDLRPVSYYGSAKYASEGLIHSFSHMNDFEALIFRFPNVIGSKLTHGVIFDFINKLKCNPRELEVLGDGLQTKPYVYIDDLIAGIQLFMRKLRKGVNIYNIGVNTATSVKDIADIIIENMNLNNVKIKYTGGQVGWKGDVAKFSFDLSKIQAEGFTIALTSTDAVRKTVNELLNNESVLTNK